MVGFIDEVNLAGKLGSLVFLVERKRRLGAAEVELGGNQDDRHGMGRQVIGRKNTVDKTGSSI